MTDLELDIADIKLTLKMMKEHIKTLETKLNRISPQCFTYNAPIYTMDMPLSLSAAKSMWPMLEREFDDYCAKHGVTAWTPTDSENFYNEFVRSWRSLANKRRYTERVIMKHIHAVLAHKDFEFPKQYYFNYEPVYAFSQKDIKTNLTLKIYNSEYDDRLFGELGLWKYLYEHEPYDWYTLHHYRRYFEEYYEHVSLPQPVQFNCNLLQQLAVMHSPKICEWLQQVLDPNDFQFLATTNRVYPYNIMSIPRELLGTWLNFVEPIIKKLIEVIGITDYEKMTEFVTNDKSFTDNKLNGQEITGKDCRPEYQCRIYAFILERLTTLFFAKLQGVQTWHCEVHLLEPNQKI